MKKSPFQPGNCNRFVAFPEVFSEQPGQVQVVVHRINTPLRVVICTLLCLLLISLREMVEMEV